MDPDGKKKSSVEKSSVLAKWRNRKKQQDSVTGLAPRPQDQPALAASGQRRLWLLQQLYPDNPFYQYGHLYTITGNLDPEILRKSFTQLLQRHEVLRSNFVQTETGELQVIVREESSPDFASISLSGSTTTERSEQARQMMQEFVLQPFDLNLDWLIRIRLLTIEPGEHWMVLSIHHIIGDRQSLTILNRELFDIYQSLLRIDKLPQLPKLDIQYLDYAYWENQRTVPDAQLNYWLEKLADIPPILNLPTDRPRPKSSSFAGAILSRKLPKSLTAAIRQFAKTESTTLFVVLLTAFKVILYRYTHQLDICVGSPFSTRDKPALEKLIGFFNETLVLKTNFGREKTFRSLIGELKQTTLAAFENKEVPYDTLIKHLAPERHGSTNPLFQVMFLYDRLTAADYSPPGLSITEEMLDLGVSKFDLTLFAVDANEALLLNMEYAKDLFDANTIQRMLGQLEVLLKNAIEQPDQLVTKLPLLGTTQRTLLLETWNGTTVDLSPYETIHQLIEEQGGKVPDQVAVISETESITYAELNEQADRIAEHLCQAGLAANSPVGLYTRRGVQTIVAMLGILKAGAAYLPLDPDYPSDRLAYMIKDAGVQQVLCHEELSSQLDLEEVLFISIETCLSMPIPNPPQKPTVTRDQLAYLIYTSGSTGRPKGVPIRHENLLYSTIARFHFYPENPSCFLLLSSYSFDSSVAGIFWTLCTGGTLVIPRKRIEQDVEALGALIATHRVTHTLLLPSLYQTLLQYVAPKDLSSLQNVMVAGEACPFSLLDRHFQTLPRTRLYNEYGPTEATVWCIAHEIRSEEQHFVPIGKAIPNARIYILDQYLEPVPIGVSGELYIGGPGLSPGYLNRPEMTKSRFLPDPFDPDQGNRIYKTGDLARYHTDGLIEFLGRADQQIKIRGFRVELGEIQRVIQQYDTVQKAIVVAKDNALESGQNNQQLVAYVSGITQQAITKLRTFLSSHLPDYMVPSAMVAIQEWPRLPNGKINRSALPDPPAPSGLSSTGTQAEPTTAIERTLLEIWQQVLNDPSLGIHDNFFSAGGDSIRSIAVLALAKKKGLQLQPNQLFEHQTIASLATQVKQREVEVPPSQKDSARESDRYPKSAPLSFLQRAFLFNAQQEQSDQGQLCLEFTFSGELDVSLFQKAWQYVVNNHGSLRTRIDSPDNHAPQQVILPEATLPWAVINWQHLDENTRSEELKLVREQVQIKKLDLSAAPVSSMTLIRCTPTQHVLLWSCHHLLLDGWSCGIILRDVRSVYDQLLQHQTIDLAPTPDFPDFLHWLDQQPSAQPTAYWQQKLGDFTTPLRFPQPNSATKKSRQFKDRNWEIPREQTSAITHFCKKQEVTLSTFFQGIWTLVLSHLFQSQDIVFGLTTTGRFSDFAGIESASGLYMNVLPNRIQFAKTTTWEALLKKIQRDQGALLKFEHNTVADIQSWIDWPDAIHLFDSLFIFGNFLDESLQKGSLSIDHFRGDFSSIYPLTIRVNPSATIQLDLQYDPAILPEQNATWIISTVSTLINFSLSENKSQRTISQLFEAVKSPVQCYEPYDLNDTKPEPATRLSSTEHTAPRTETELALHKIWSVLFGEIQIGIHDNFFDLGGNSLMAIRLFTAIEKELQQIHPPSSLLQHPTIAQLAILLADDPQKNQSAFSCLIPMRSQGDQAPLFCLHGGGAHVFFYQAFTQHLSEEIPVYSLQPLGLGGGQERHRSIQEMASHYIQEMKLVQPAGPYRILGTCFSNAVALEIANQLTEEKEEVAFFAIIDSGPVHLFGDDEDGKSKTWVRFLDLLKRGDFHRIGRKILNRLSPSQKSPLTDTTSETEAEKNLRLTIESLNELYAKYHWQPYPGKIHFFRSTEFHQRKDKKYHLTQWEQLAKAGLELHIVEGHHETLFEEPEVQGLAKKIEACLS